MREAQRHLCCSHSVVAAGISCYRCPRGYCLAASGVYIIRPALALSCTLTSSPPPHRCQASTVVLGYVASMLAEYEARKAANFLEKDAAIALLIAAAVKTQVTSLGGALCRQAGRRAAQAWQLPASGDAPVGAAVPRRTPVLRPNSHSCFAHCVLYPAPLQ